MLVYSQERATALLMKRLVSWNPQPHCVGMHALRT